MLNPTQEVLAAPAKPTETREPLAAQSITLRQVGRIVVAASAAGLVVGLLFSYVLYYRLGIGQLDAL
jgi:hypothetical protein